MSVYDLKQVYRPLSLSKWILTTQYTDMTIGELKEKYLKLVDDYNNKITDIFEKEFTRLKNNLINVLQHSKSSFEIFNSIDWRKKEMEALNECYKSLYINTNNL